MKWAPHPAYPGDVMARSADPNVYYLAYQSKHDHGWRAYAFNTATSKFTGQSPVYQGPRAADSAREWAERQEAPHVD